MERKRQQEKHVAVADDWTNKIFDVTWLHEKALLSKTRKWHARLPKEVKRITPVQLQPVYRLWNVTDTNPLWRKLIGVWLTCRSFLTFSTQSSFLTQKLADITMDRSLFLNNESTFQITSTGVGFIIFPGATDATDETQCFSCRRLETSV